MRHIAGILLSLPCLADVSRSGERLEDLYPTAEGTVWIYETPDKKLQESRAVGKKKLGDKEYVVLDHADMFGTQRAKEYLFAGRDELNVPAIGYDRLNGLADPAYVLLRGPLRVGGSWSTKTTWKYENSATVWDIRVDGKFAARETITVPAGRFHCWKVELVYKWTGSSSVEYVRTLWLAPGVGIVRAICGPSEVAAPAVDLRLKEFRPKRR
jgi:hypothetical protein